MDLQGLGKYLVLAGVALALLGMMMWAGGRLGLGSLPGDLQFTRERWGCYAPFTSMILLSVVLTIIANVILRLMNR